MTDISMTDQLRSLVRDVLAQSELPEQARWDLEEGLFTLVAKLNRYQEEGALLRPEIYLFPLAFEKAFVTKSGFHHFFEIDRVPPERARGYDGGHLFEEIIKRCAPLARSGWRVFVKWNEDYLAYGVMRRELDLINSPPETLLREPGEAIPYLMLRESARGVIEVFATRGLKTSVSFTAGGFKIDSAANNLGHFIAASLSDLRSEDPRGFISATLTNVFREVDLSGFGYLVALERYRGDLQNADTEWLRQPTRHESLADGTFFQRWPIPIHAKAKMLEGKLSGTRSSGDRTVSLSIERYSELQAWANLIPLMLNSDGITVVNTRAQVVGYNVFIREQNIPIEPRRYVPDAKPKGGARSRAFEQLCRLVDAGHLVGTLYHSQDGLTAWYGPGMPENE